MPYDRSFVSGQSHLNSDATIAHEGRPQGAPLPIVFSRRFVLRRAPTRGAPTDCLLSALCPAKGTHKGCPYRLSSLGVMPWGGRPQGAPLPIVFSRRYALGRAPTRGAPTDCLLSAFYPGGGGRTQGAPLPIVFSGRYALGRAPTRGAPTDCLLSAFGPAKGAHKGCPYRLSSLGVWPCEGRPQGVPLPIVFSRRLALRRAPTRGAPTDCLLSAFYPAKGTHKGRPYRLSSLGVWPWEGRPQGVPLPIVFSRRLALRRAPTRGAPTDCLLSAFYPGGGRTQGAPLPIVFSRRFALRRAHTRGAPTDCLLPAFCPAKGTHKGCPYRLSSLGVLPRGRAHTRGAPTDCLLSAFGFEKGAHKGRPYRLSSPGVLSCEGHPQGVPLPIVFSRRFVLRRAPTRGAPTDCLLSAFCPAKGTHKGRPYRLSSLGVLSCEGHPQGAPLPIVFSRRFTPGEGAHKGCPYPIVFSRGFALGRAHTRGAPTRFRQPHEVFSNLMQLS